MKQYLLYFILLSSVLNTNAQSLFPKNYFRNPLGIPMGLAANFGAIRKNHYHMGLDIRTQQRENLPVYAAQSGYISRVSVQQGGYGRAIYITHPNGYTTVYAHLNKFYDPLENYLQEQQYKTKQWTQDIKISPFLFPVTKGQFIAWSGNTGASEGPHLHFEIRNTITGNCLNPLLGGFLTDNIAPSLLDVYWYDRSQGIYEKMANVITIKKTDTVEFVNSRKISFGIKAIDKINATSFSLGVYEAKIFIDGKILASFKLDSVSYHNTRYSNAAIDYPAFINKQGIIQHLSRLSGDHLHLLQSNNDGILVLNDELPHEILIEVKDIAGNASVRKFNIQYNPDKQSVVSENIIATKLKPNATGVLSNNEAHVVFSKQALYDTVSFALFSTASTSPYVSAITTISPTTVPVHDDYIVSLKLNDTAYASYKNKMVMQWKGEKSQTVAKATTKDNRWYSAPFGELGSVALVIDTVPPDISPAGWKDSTAFGTKSIIRIQCTDDYKEIRNFSAILDDSQWLLFAPLGNDYTYKIDKYCPVGTHKLTVKAEDIVGNKTIENFYFIVKEENISQSVKKSPKSKKKINRKISHNRIYKKH